MFPPPRRYYECPQCLLRIVVGERLHFSELQTDNLRCCCGATPVLLNPARNPATRRT